MARSDGGMAKVMEEWQEMMEEWQEVMAEWNCFRDWGTECITCEYVLVQDFIFIHLHSDVIVFSRVLHTRCCHIQAHAFPLSVTMRRSSEEQGSSSSHCRGGG